MARIKIIDQFDSSFSLDAACQAQLFELLTQPSFLAQVAQQADCDQVRFTEQLFQPVPYTRQTPRGMPPEFEQYHQSPTHVIINVPPPFMFKAKIFQPSRLCAVYQKLNSQT
jgi:hypothetical protein